MSVANLQTEWCRLLMDSFAAAGVREVVVSPGSRSTPLLFAALEHPDLRCHRVMDERSAGFFALGLARATGCPPLLLCTSGTAPAHYFPAVIEASASGIPLLILSADRPLELQGNMAAQTIDQTRLFGAFAREYVDLGHAEPYWMSLRALRRRVVQAVHLAAHGQPGPVHLNARARKPLEPQAATDEEGATLEQLVQQLIATPVPQVMTALTRHTPESMRSLAAALARNPRGLIVVGPLPPSPSRQASGVDREQSASASRAPNSPTLSAEASDRALQRALETLSRMTGYPLLLESTSQHRFDAHFSPETPVIDGFEHLLRDIMVREVLRPDIILQVGGTLTSGAFDAWMSVDTSIERHVISPLGWVDSFNSVSSLSMGHVPSAVESLCEALREQTVLNSGARSEWSARWKQLNACAWRAVNEVIHSATDTALEATVVQTLLEQLPDETALFLGNSLPIREVDLYAQAREGLSPIFFQRGVNGIDGMISGACGLIMAHKKPMVTLIGDVTFLHDAMGLACAVELPAALVLVVIHNGGGRIFDLLPVARATLSQPERMAWWTTPHHVSIEALARAHTVRYHLITSSEALAVAVLDALAYPVCTVLEVRVDGAQTARISAECRAKVSAGLQNLIRDWTQTV